MPPSLDETMVTGQVVILIECYNFCRERIESAAHEQLQYVAEPTTRCVCETLYVQ